MHFSANKVTGVVCGDYYQLVLEADDGNEGRKDDLEQTTPYLLLQRQFEFSDAGKCYVESDDETYIGHFKLKLIEFTPNRLAFEIGRKNHNHVEVSFALTVAEFEESRPVAEVIFGIREPYYEDEF